jgi:hypothetical protein
MKKPVGRGGPHWTQHCGSVNAAPTRDPWSLNAMMQPRVNVIPRLWLPACCKAFAN